MPPSIPTASTLLSAAAKYLQEELMPTLSGYHRFQTRVTVNVLHMIQRELELRGTHESAERQRLARLIGHDAPMDVLNNELCDLIRADRINVEDPVLRDHIRQSLDEALEVNNPKWVNS